MTRGVADQPTLPASSPTQDQSCCLNLRGPDHRPTSCCCSANAGQNQRCPRAQQPGPVPKVKSCDPWRGADWNTPIAALPWLRWLAWNAAGIRSAARSVPCGLPRAPIIISWPGILGGFANGFPLTDGTTGSWERAPDPWVTPPQTETPLGDRLPRGFVPGMVNRGGTRRGNAILPICHLTLFIYICSVRD